MSNTQYVLFYCYYAPIKNKSNFMGIDDYLFSVDWNYYGMALIWFAYAAIKVIGNDEQH